MHNTNCKKFKGEIEKLYRRKVAVVAKTWALKSLL